MHSGSVGNRETIVLVTGIGGFLGGHIARQLLAKGYAVRGSVRRMSDCDRIAKQICATPTDSHSLSFVEADLCSDIGWDAAVTGCSYVIHTASPFPAGLPKDENELIQPARDGALRVLRAAHRAGVTRVVLTSSIAATNHGERQGAVYRRQLDRSDGQAGNALL
jgi:nucleoside-diphosphate-sugar epimerase